MSTLTQDEYDAIGKLVVSFVKKHKKTLVDITRKLTEKDVGYSYGSQIWKGTQQFSTDRALKLLDIIRQDEEYEPMVDLLIQNSDELRTEGGLRLELGSLDPYKLAINFRKLAETGESHYRLKDEQVSEIARKFNITNVRVRSTAERYLGKDRE